MGHRSEATQVVRFLGHSAPISAAEALPPRHTGRLAAAGGGDADCMKPVLTDRVPRPSIEQRRATGGLEVDRYLGGLCELVGDPSIRAAVMEALFIHPAVQRKIRQHVARRMGKLHRCWKLWEADELYAIASLRFVEAVDRFDGRRANASFLGLLELSLCSIGFELQAQRSELTADAIAGRVKRGRPLEGTWEFLTDERWAGIAVEPEAELEELEIHGHAASSPSVIEVVRDAIEAARLDERERAVTLARVNHASTDGHPPTNDAVATALGMSSSTVQRANASARRKLRHVAPRRRG